MIRCPNCGAYLDIQKPTLTFRQQRIRKAVRQKIIDLGRLPYSEDIAVDFDVTYRTILYDLRYLEQIGEVHRPDGPRSGWAIQDHSHITLIREIA